MKSFTLNQNQNNNKSSLSIVAHLPANIMGEISEFLTTSEMVRLSQVSKQANQKFNDSLFYNERIISEQKEYFLYAHIKNEREVNQVKNMAFLHIQSTMAEDSVEATDLNSKVETKLFET